MPSGEFDSATVAVSGLDLASRALLAGGRLITALMYLTLAAAVVFVCVSLFRGRPFSRSSTWRLAVASHQVEERGMILTRLAELVDLSIVNLSVLKNNRAKAIRFSTLYAICQALECDVGDLLVMDRPATAHGDS